LVPVLHAVSHDALAKGAYPEPGQPTIASPLFWPPAATLASVADRLQYTFPVWMVLGLVMLYLGYRNSPSDDRRRIRWLLVGMVAALGVSLALLGLAWVLDPDSTLAISMVAWPLFVALALASIVVAIFHDGVLGIDRPLRRSMVYRTLVGLIALAYVASAVALGVLASRYLPIGAAVLLAVSATLLFQPVRGRLERWADRWVFGARLDGYEVLSRFGATLESSPGPTELLPELADAVRNGLGLRWARVRLDPAEASDVPPAGAAGIGVDDAAEPALVVSLTHAGSVLGHIECGPRLDGPLLAEDRALLRHLAGQAATAVRNLHLTSELSARLEVIRRQAAQLTASRARVVRAQDAERQRIQRDLHDGVQQDLVVLSAKLAMARERLRRGDPRVGEPLADLQRDVGTLLANLREFAHSIHPPVLADQGLLEAIEAQAARLPVEVVIEADPALRGVRYPQHVETAAWYLLSEALTNAVKHACARQVFVALGQPNGRLVVQVRDDGRGFDPTSPRGLGLSGLADRMSIVDGTLEITSGPWQGTSLRAEIPLTGPEATDG
jgi:signal transduction histidine kinase